MRKIVIIMMLGMGFVFNPVNSTAQENSFTYTESLTSSLFVEKDWDALIQAGKLAEKSGLDYFALNLRIGAAYFFKKEYYAAQRYLMKAYRQNSGDIDVNNYLHWTYFNLGNTFRANDFQVASYDSIYVTGRKYFSLNLGGGMKGSNRKELFGNVLVGFAGVKYELNRSQFVQVGYTHLQQDKNIWGKYNQEEIHLGTDINLKKGWVYTLSVHPVIYQSTMQYAYDKDTVHLGVKHKPFVLGEFDTTIINRRYIHGKYNQSAANIFMSITKSIGRFTLQPLGSIYLLRNEPDFIESVGVYRINRFLQQQVLKSQTTDSMIVDNITHNQRSNEWSGNAGLYFNVIPPGFKDKISFGMNLLYAFDSSGKGTAIYSPEISIMANKYVTLFGSWFKKGNEVVSLHSGSSLYNNSNKIHSLLSLGIQVRPAKPIAVSCILQREKLTDTILEEKYAFNTLLINLTITP